MKIEFGKSLSSVLEYLNSIEKNIRGQVSHTVTQTELLIFILQCQNLFRVSKNVVNLIKTFVHGDVFEVPRDERIKTRSSHFHNVQDESKSVDETELDTEIGLHMVEEIIKIMEYLKPKTDSKIVSCVGDLLMIIWLIDQIGGLRNNPIAYRMVRQLHSTLKKGKDSLSLVLYYIACENSTTTNELVIDIINLLSCFCESHWNLTIKHKPWFQDDDFVNTAQLLNDILTGIYRHKFSVSCNKMEKALVKQVKKLEGMIIFYSKSEGFVLCLSVLVYQYSAVQVFLHSVKVTTVVALLNA